MLIGPIMLLVMVPPLRLMFRKKPKARKLGSNKSVRLVSVLSAQHVIIFRSISDGRASMAMTTGLIGAFLIVVILWEAFETIIFPRGSPGGYV